MVGRAREGWARGGCLPEGHTQVGLGCVPSVFPVPSLPGSRAGISKSLEDLKHAARKLLSLR